MSNFEDFIDKLAAYPNDVNRLARLIRNLDKRVQNIQASLSIQQKKFQIKIKELKDKKQTQISAQLRAQYQNIVQKQKQLYGYARQKQAVAQQLQCVINNSYELVKNDLKNKIKDKPSQDQSMLTTKKKKKPIQNMIKTIVKQQQFLYDNINPRYCYCVGGSYGQMVGCENNYCQKEWFHSQCIDDKNYMNQADWHCKDCKKLVEKFKKSNTIKEFI